MFETTKALFRAAFKMMNAKPKSSQPEGPVIVATARCSISIGTCGAGVRKFKRMSYLLQLRLPSLPQLNDYEHGLCLLLDRTLERFDQRAGVEGGSGGRQVCLLGFSHTTDQVQIV